MAETDVGVPPGPPPAPPPINGEHPLDAYSRVVTTVASRLIPSVASLRVMVRVTGGRRPQGSGSGVVVTPDGYLLTSAHVVEHAARGFSIGFLTKEFTVDRGQGPEQLIAVYVPTNHLYLGDIKLYPRASAFYPDVTVEEGIRIFLTGGMSLPGKIKSGAP